MRTPTIDTIVIASALILQAVLAIVLVWKKLSRNYPIFTIYLFLNLIEDPLGWALQRRWDVHGNSPYFRYYFVVTLLDYILQLLILLEIGWNVMRPSRRSISFPILPVVTVGALLCALIAISFTPQVVVLGAVHGLNLLLQLSLVLAILKILLFMALAGFAQLLGIGWKNHVLQLATGFAIYGTVSFFVQYSSAHLEVGRDGGYTSHLVRLAQIQSAAYLATLVFWTWAFSRNEAPRKEFTPQMQEILVTIAQSAKRTRLAVTRSTDRR